MSNSSNKGVAAITGASSGIGAVYADRLAKLGLVVRRVPAKSHRPGSAGSAAGSVRTGVHAANPRRITAIGGAHRPLSRFTRGANTRGLDVPPTC
jgi:NAD(P)-dependent dehydrogenase (short-subunit alcohol dehydrogenase family)